MNYKKEKLSNLTLSMSKVIKRNGKYNEGQKRKLRKSFNINIKGLKKDKSIKKIIEEATEIRASGRRIRNIEYAYDFLADLYNDIIEDFNEDKIKNKIQQQKKNKKKRTEADKIKKIVRTFRLSGKETTINVNKNLKTEDIMRIIVENMKGDKVVIRFDYTDGSVKYRPLNDITISDILQTINLEENELEFIDESDKDFRKKFNIIQSLTLEKPRVYFNKSGSIKTKSGGAFFKWINKTDFNLTAYGVFKEVSTKNYENNCLINAFIKYGLDEKRINFVKSFVINREVPMCKLQQVADKLKICIKLQKDDNNKKAYLYGKEYKEVIEIAVIDKHYFLNDKVDFTSYALKNYFELSKKYTSIEDFRYMIKAKGEKNKDRCMNSYNAIKFLYENRAEYLEPMVVSEEILKTQYYDSVEDKDNLEYLEQNCLLNEVKEPRMDYENYTNVFFDFETYQHKKCINNKEKIVFVPYIVCGKIENGEEISKIGIDCGEKFLDYLNHIIPYTTTKTKEGEKKRKYVRLIAHNCKFDYTFLFKYVNRINQITSGTKLLNAKCSYKELDIEFKCSLTLITMPLKKFPKVFNIPEEKEVMPYKLYNEENCKKEMIRMIEAKDYLNDNDYNHMVKVCKTKGFIEKINGELYFDCMDYAKYYCMRDCEVLMKGYETFKGWIITELGIDINSVWTSASLSDKYFMNEGVYEGVYKLSGLPRQFIQKCVVGGRTMCRDNIKHKVEGEKMADYDGVSLYPSAMARMEGILMGKPKILQPNQLHKSFLDSVNGYFLKIKITNVKQYRHFSLLSEVNSKSGVRMFHNDMIGKVLYVDKVSLEDMIEFQGVEFEVICGYYYDEGRNETIREVITKVFNMRKEMKRVGNPIQEVYKLIMNSGYGKSILKPIEKEERVFDSSKEKDKWVSRYYNYIVEAEQGYECDKWIVKQHKAINEHFNNCVFGVEVLSMSKRIMNEVMCLAEDNELTAYYQDTDSIHMKYDQVAVLKQKFSEKYGREIDGKDLGQFHIDFELKGAETKTIYAEKSIFLGKKCYIDMLVGLDENGNEIRGEHLRMKGIPNSSIYYTAERLGCSVYNIYEKLYEGEEINFDLLEGGNKVQFEFNKNMSVFISQDFKRTIKFK